MPIHAHLAFVCSFFAAKNLRSYKKYRTHHFRVLHGDVSNFILSICMIFIKIILDMFSSRTRYIAVYDKYFIIGGNSI